jgi:hypothetical protein
MADGVNVFGTCRIVEIGRLDFVWIVLGVSVFHVIVVALLIVLGRIGLRECTVWERRRDWFCVWRRVVGGGSPGKRKQEKDHWLDGQEINAF